jgi:hypothetical protein
MIWKITPSLSDLKNANIFTLTQTLTRDT